VGRIAHFSSTTHLRDDRSRGVFETPTILLPRNPASQAVHNHHFTRPTSIHSPCRLSFQKGQFMFEQSTLTYGAHHDTKRPFRKVPSLSFYLDFNTNLMNHVSRRRRRDGIEWRILGKCTAWAFCGRRYVLRMAKGMEDVTLGLGFSLLLVCWG
jgi:hypothetical protein